MSEKFERKGKSEDGKYRMENKCTQRENWVDNEKDSEVIEMSKIIEWS